MLFVCNIGRMCNRCTGFVAVTTEPKREMSASACSRCMHCLSYDTKYNMYHLYPNILFWNKWRKEWWDQLTQVSLENDHQNWGSFLIGISIVITVTFTNAKQVSSSTLLVDDSSSSLLLLPAGLWRSNSPARSVLSFSLYFHVTSVLIHY